MGKVTQTGHSLFDVTEANPTFRLLRLLGISVVLTLVFWLAVSSLVRKSPTFDEQGFIVRGLAYLRDPSEGGTRRIRVGHPPGLNAYNALLLAADKTVRLPTEDPSWQGTSFHRPAELFLWEIGNDVEHIMFLARLPTVWLGLLLIALVGRWAAEMASGGFWRRGRGSRSVTAGAAGLLALMMTAFDPNLLAHMRLATTDFGLTATAALAGYGLWRLVRRPSWVSAVAAGIGLGPMLNTKFTALLFVPLFGLVWAGGLIVQWRSRVAAAPLRVALIPMLLLYPLATLLTLWAGTGFDMGLLPNGVLLPQMDGATVPMAHYLEQLLDIGGRLQVETPAFLLGHFRTTGWWYYFPVVFLLKTPLPTLGLLLWGVVSTGMLLWTRRLRLAGRNWLDLSALLIPVIGFFAIAMTTDINLGYRHILPVLPFLYVFIGVSLGQSVAPLMTLAGNGAALGGTKRAWLAVGLTGGLVVVSLWIYPDYLAYFNTLAGGPGNGWRSLVDSNLDWGQDLQSLGPWMEENNVSRVWLSYFGEARPDYYGITYDGLDSFPPRLMNPQARPFVPSNPAPGWYAISATNLQGVHFFNHDEFAVFRNRMADDKLGYSMFLYQVEPAGEAVNVLLSGVQPDEIAPDDFALLGTNDVEFRWFDGRQVAILPQNGQPTWLFAGADMVLLPEWTAMLEGTEVDAAAGEANYTINRLPEDLPGPGSVLAPFSSGEGAIDLLESTTANQIGRTLDIVTVWQQRAKPAPVKIFIHVLDESGSIMAQWDGLDAAWEGWRQGDVLRQHSALLLPEATPAGTYKVVTGLYNPVTLERWRLPSSAETVELARVTVP